MLQKAAAARPDAGLLEAEGARQLEHRRLLLGGIFHPFPERSREVRRAVGHDEPRQPPHVFGRNARRRAPHQIGAPQETPLQQTCAQRLAERRPASRRLGQPIVAVIVVESRLLAPPLAQGRHQGTGPQRTRAGRLGMGLEPRLERRLALGGPGKITAKHVRRKPHGIGQPLIRSAPQVGDAAPGHADVAEQQLHHSGRARRLGPRAVLHETGPGQHLARPLHRARGREGPIGALEQRPLHAADGGHRVQVVAGEKLLQAHPGASRVLQRDIALAARLGRHGPGRDALTAHPGELAVEAHVPRVEAVGLIAPTGLVVGAGHGIPAEEGAA